MNVDEQALAAATELVGRTGAKSLEIGYLHDDVPSEKAAWYAHAQYRGTRITVENQPGPLEAVERLALKLLTGARCKCGKLVALRADGAIAFPGRMLDGSTGTEEQIRQAGQCRWARDGATWKRGCA